MRRVQPRPVRRLSDDDGSKLRSGRARHHDAWALGGRRPVSEWMQEKRGTRHTEKRSSASAERAGFESAAWIGLAFRSSRVHPALLRRQKHAPFLARPIPPLERAEALARRARFLLLWAVCASMERHHAD